MRARRELRGLGGAAGTALGPCTVLANLTRFGKTRETSVRHSKTYIAEHAIDDELARLRGAVERAQGELTVAMGSLSAVLGEQRAILEAYFLMLDDPMFHEKIRAHVQDGRLCAEWAVSEAADELRAAFAKLDPHGPAAAHLVERQQDIDFIADKLLRSLNGAHAPPLLQNPSIVVATDLSPAELAQLDRRLVLGLVVERGTKTSHTSILARALGLPTVVGAHDATRSIRTGDELFIDGREGLVIVHPTTEDRARTRVAFHAPDTEDAEDGQEQARGEARCPCATQHTGQEQARGEARCPCATQHTGPTLAATIQLPGELDEVFRHGGKHVGLCRTEFLFLGCAAAPDEQDQVAMYSELVRSMNGGSIVLRTFDLGGDKPSHFLAAPREQNPALGMRALRIGLRDPGLFLAQARAIHRASVYGDVRILLPMVSTLGELRAAKQLLAEAAREVGGAPLPLGIMVEVPSAAVLADQLAREVDFLSVGLNDLVQYTLAVDRTSMALTELASPLDPAVLRLTALTCVAARAAGVPISVCGAATADPVAAIVYAGLGADTLSMNASAIPLVREALRRVGRNAAERLAARVLELGTAAEVESYLARELEPQLGALLQERM